MRFFTFAQNDTDFSCLPLIFTPTSRLVGDPVGEGDHEVVEGEIPIQSVGDTETVNCLLATYFVLFKIAVRIFTFASK